jgi:hypothetical protein
MTTRPKTPSAQQPKGPLFGGGGVAPDEKPLVYRRIFVAATTEVPRRRSVAARRYQVWRLLRMAVRMPLAIDCRDMTRAGILRHDLDGGTTIMGIRDGVSLVVDGPLLRVVVTDVVRVLAACARWADLVRASERDPQTCARRLSAVSGDLIAVAASAADTQGAAEVVAHIAACGGSHRRLFGSREAAVQWRCVKDVPHAMSLA